jgi:hypothetical protein
MASNGQIKSWVGKGILCFILGGILLFILAPMPGLGAIFPIWDNLRGHPQRTHGTHPQNFVGLWVRDEVKMFDFVGQAFYLMPDGELAGYLGMTRRHWHFDDNSFFVDSVSLCGNCYRGNVTTEHTVKFDGADQMIVGNKKKSATRGVSGLYHRVEITDELRSELNCLKKSEDENESFKAGSVLRAIEHIETLSRFKNKSRANRNQ